MKARLSGLLAAPAALLLFGCISDPVSDLDGGAAAVVTSASQLVLLPDSSGFFTASVVDERAIPLATPVTFTAREATVTVQVDTSYHPVPVTSARAKVTAGLAPDTTYVIASGGGRSDSVRIIIQ